MRLFALLIAGLFLALAAIVSQPPPAAASVTVAAGDTLSGIAARNGVSVSALAAANGLSDPDRIGIGTRLTLPGASSGAGTAVVATASSSAGTGTTGGGASVTVAAGDTLSGIAARNGVSVSALAAANGLSDPDRIGIGTRLTLPGASSAGSSGGATSGGELTGGRTPGVEGLLEQSAARHGVSPDLVRAIAWQESGWNQAAVSSVGATGVMQLMPGTARWLGEDVLGRTIDRSRVEDNVDGGAAYLAWLIRHMGDERAGIAAYYQGQGSVSAHGPLPETDRYVASVLSLRGRV